MKNTDNSSWEIPKGLDVTYFDFNWKPNMYDPPLIHQFGTQHQKTGGPKYIVPGATGVKYRDEMLAKKLPDMTKWRFYSEIEEIQFDYSWHHDETEPPMNYVFGDQYGDAEERKPLIYFQGENLPYKCVNYPKAKIKYRPLDIIFLSNGETNEERRYNRLCEISKREVTWVRNIKGRENAIRHAAEISKTKWFLLFPGKLYADENFDFNFQPLKSYEPKHYIFYAKNPVNNLVYGHQAAVCYNKEIVLNTVEFGLDFTMSGSHDVVPIISGTTEYTDDSYMAWRTAFREAIKLKHTNDKESLERLEIWLTIGLGSNGKYSISGAQDGIEFYDSVKGDYEKLKLTFSWDWLNVYFNDKYKKL